MATNLPTKVSQKCIESIEKFTEDDEQDLVIWLQTMDELFDEMKVTDSDRHRLLPLYFDENVKKWYGSSIEDLNKTVESSTRFS